MLPRSATVSIDVSHRLYRRGSTTLTTPDGEPTTGIQFDSRRGDQLTLWAIYERSASTPSPPEITNYSEPQVITEHDPDLTEAMRIHHLTWAA